MQERIQRTCRYGHGPLERLTGINEKGEFRAFSIAGTIMSFNSESEAPAGKLTVSSDMRQGYILSMHKCKVCGYLELDDFTPDDVNDAIQAIGAGDAVGRK